MVYRVLPPLNTLFGVERATKSQLLTMLWTYVTVSLFSTSGGPQFMLFLLYCYLQTHDLLDSRSCDVILNNDALKSAFRTDRTELSSLPGKLFEFLAPLEPIEIFHDLRYPLLFSSFFCDSHFIRLLLPPSRLSGPFTANEACYDMSVEVLDSELTPPPNILPALNLRQLAAWDGEVRSMFRCVGWSIAYLG